MNYLRRTGIWARRGWRVGGATGLAGPSWRPTARKLSNTPTIWFLPSKCINRHIWHWNTVYKTTSVCPWAEFETHGPEAVQHTYDALPSLPLSVCRIHFRESYTLEGVVYASVLQGSGVSVLVHGPEAVQHIFDLVRCSPSLPQKNLRILEI